MKTKPQLWSVRRLSRELGRSRKSIARALQYVEADDWTSHGPVWRLPTALTAIAEHDEFHRYDGGRDDSFEMVRWTNKR
jgi:hypothetical protein